MKKLFFLLLFPCFALAQYQGNANQKITLGEQTTADGLVWRGRLADTANLLTNKLDTSVYIVLDTGTQAMWYYRVSTTPKWTRLVDSINNLQGQLSLTSKVTGVLPVANGGTGQSTLAAAGINTGSGTLNYLPKYTAATTFGNSLIFDNGSNVGIGTTSLTAKLDVNGDIKFKNNLSGEITSSGAQIVFYNNANQPFWINMQNNNNTGRFICGVEGTAGATFTGSSANSSFFGSNAGDLHILSNGSIRQTITSTGNIGIGTVSPTARLHLAAGTASASSAPLKFTSGTNLTTAEAGAMEFNGTNLFFSPSTTRHTVNHGLTGSATLDFPSTTTLLSADLTITVTGAADGDVVSLGVPNAAVNANTCYTAWVSAANTVTVRFNNYSSGTVNPASGTFKVFVTK